jgi:hypothetical protein
MNIDGTKSQISLLKNDGISCVLNLKQTIAQKNNISYGNVMIILEGDILKDTDVLNEKKIYIAIIKKTLDEKKEVKQLLSDQEYKEFKSANLEYVVSFLINQSPHTFALITERLNSIDETVCINLRHSAMSGDSHTVKQVIYQIVNKHYDMIINLFKNEYKINCEPIKEQDWINVKYMINDLKFGANLVIDTYNRCNKDPNITANTLFDLMG